MTNEGLAAAQQRMHDAHIPTPAIDVFTRFYHLLEHGEQGLIRETDITPLRHPARLTPTPTHTDAITQTAVIKLNGGLATSMGMDRAKSLLTVRHTTDGQPLTFLDITARQILATRDHTGARLPLLLMNSFRTQADTLAALAAYPELPTDGLPADFLQHKEPKLTTTLEPAHWPARPDLEWCPPGHGDIYTALHATGILNQLRAHGYRYAAISNADNLGATPDPAIAAWFAASGAPYAAEVVAKTPADRKGGTLVYRTNGRLALRDTAQVHPDDTTASQDITTHPYFHTNNLWFDLDALATQLEHTDGILHLPLIRNTKTIDPADPTSPHVIQIESAMGAAIELFEGSLALEVDRSRFLPVKTTNDLMLIRSDVYHLDDDYRLTTHTPAPLIDLDPTYYRTLTDYETRIKATPSLRGAHSLTIRGDWTLGAHTTITANPTLTNTGNPHHLPDHTVINSNLTHP